MFWIESTESCAFLIFINALFLLPGGQLHQKEESWNGKKISSWLEHSLVDLSAQISVNKALIYFSYSYYFGSLYTDAAPLSRSPTFGCWCVNNHARLCVCCFLHLGSDGQQQRFFFLSCKMQHWARCIGNFGYEVDNEGKTTTWVHSLILV